MGFSYLTLLSKESITFKMETAMSYFTEKFDGYFGKLSNNELIAININDILAKVNTFSTYGKLKIEQEVIEVSIGMTEHLKVHNSTQLIPNKQYSRIKQTSL
jgi:hypothetical protein